MNGGHYPWAKGEQGNSNCARRVAHGEPQNTYNNFADGRSVGWPPSNKPGKGSDGWEKSQKNVGQATKWRDQGRGELISNYESIVIGIDVYCKGTKVFLTVRVNIYLIG